MQVLIFGTTGQLALALARQVPAGVTATQLPRVAADLADPAACAAAILAARPDVVINAAAYTAVDRAETDAAMAMRVNGDSPAAMAQACADLGIPFLHVSTDYVFDGSGTAPLQPDDATGPLGVYGRSKLAGEQGIRAAGGAYAILRTSWVFSADGANFVKTMLRLSETRDRLSVVGDQTGGPTPAAAISAALWRMAQAFHAGQGAVGSLTGTYHFAGGPDVTWAAFARAIFAAAGRNVNVADITTSAYPTPAPRPLNSRMDCTCLETVFGIPRPDWRAGLGDVLAALQAGA